MKDFRTEQALWQMSFDHNKGSGRRIFLTGRSLKFHFVDKKESFISGVELVSS